MTSPEHSRERVTWLLRNRDSRQLECVKSAGDSSLFEDYILDADSVTVANADKRHGPLAAIYAVTNLPQSPKISTVDLFTADAETERAHRKVMRDAVFNGIDPAEILDRELVVDAIMSTVIATRAAKHQRLLTGIELRPTSTDSDELEAYVALLVPPIFRSAPRLLGMVIRDKSFPGGPKTPPKGYEEFASMRDTARAARNLAHSAMYHFQVGESFRSNRVL